MPVFISLCTADFGYHSGCGDGWWCWLYLRRRTAAMFVQSRSQTDCLASSPGLVALQQVSAPILLLPPPTPHLWKNNTLAETFRDTSEVARGRAGVVVDLRRRGRKDPGRSAAAVGVCQGPGKHNKAGRRNFPLTLEIGTSCATTQSNHVSYFTDRPAWHMLATEGYFVFRSTIIHPQNRFQPIPSPSSTGVTKTDCCYVTRNTRLGTIYPVIKEEIEDVFGMLTMHTFMYSNCKQKNVFFMSFVIKIWCFTWTFCEVWHSADGNVVTFPGSRLSFLFVSTIRRLSLKITLNF